MLVQALTSYGPLLLLIAAALGAFVLIAVLVAVPDWTRRARYRPGLTWNADLVWFNGPGGDAASGDAARRAAERAAEQAAERAAEQSARRIAGQATGSAVAGGRAADVAGAGASAAQETDVDPSTGGARATW
jgi:sRNA-binding protein